MTLARAPRPIVGHPVPVQFELVELGLITRQQLADARTAAQEHGREVRLTSSRPASTLEQSSSQMSYCITDGDSIAVALPWLYTLYQTLIPRLVLDNIGLEIRPSAFRRSAITLNVLAGTGNRYESHIDSNSITGLLFASTISAREGGTLRMHYPHRPLLDIAPSEGTLLIYDARWVPHEVMPLLADVTRVSIPMNYFLPTDIELRPEHLDAYIFGDG